ncbi:MAG: T9SS type A sorting domain-containing protein [Bacteroidota bacterium]
MKRPKIFAWILATAILISPYLSQSQIQYRWGKALGQFDREQITDLCFDQEGNLLLSAEFTDSLDIEDGSGINFLPGGGFRDIMIAKIDPAGNFLWAHGMGDAAWDRPWSITCDPQGNVYSGGVFSRRVDFDPGPDSTILQANTRGFWPDGYVSKYAPNGDLIWAKHLLTARGLGSSPTATLLTINGMGVDGNGDLVIGGAFWDTVYFAPTQPNVSFTVLRDMFLAKYDSDGNHIWTQHMGGAGDQEIEDLAFDSDGNIYCTGFFYGSPDFDPGSGTLNLTSEGNGDIFLAKYSPNGALLWVHAFGTADNANSQPEQGRGIGVDSLGNVYFTGRFYGDIDFDPGPGDATINLVGSSDAVIAKYDPSGSFQWAFSLAGTGSEIGQDIVVHPNGDFYIAGNFGGELDLDPGPDSSIVSSTAGQGSFYAQFDSEGNFVDGLGLRSLQSSELTRLAANASGVVIGGSFMGTFLMGTKTEPDLRFSAGNADLFLASYGTGSTAIGSSLSFFPMQIFPNPSQQKIHIKGDWSASQEVKLDILDQMGKVVHHESFISNQKIDKQLFIQHLPSGTYYLHLKTKQGVSVKKFVKI